MGLRGAGRDRRGLPVASSVLPAEEFLRPAPIAALVLMAINDHLLKGAGLLPGWLTGKLSDLAGIFFFPLLLTALIRTGRWLVTRERRPLTPALLGGAIAATAVVFSLVQLVPSLMAWWPAHTADPTDLVALPMLALTWRSVRV